LAGTGGDEGSHGMMGTVVFVAAFLATILFMMSSFSPILAPGNTAADNQPTIPGFSASDMSNYQYYNTSAGHSFYNATPAMRGATIIIPSISFGNTPTEDGGWSNMSWSVNGITVRAYLVASYFDTPILPLGGYKSSVNDAWIFWAHTGIWDSKWTAISYGDIEKKIARVNGVQRASVVIDVGQPLTVFFIFPSLSDADILLKTHTGYQIILGQSQAQALAAQQNNAWNYVTGILTFNMPNGGTGVSWFDFIISATVDAAILYIAFWALTRLIGAFMP
jgi:hypothetical protein